LQTKATLRYKREEPEARIIEAVQRVGPQNISLIAKLADLPVETVRYKLKREFKHLGFRIHSEVDHSKLGLSLHVAELRFEQEYRDVAGRLLASLHEIGYLLYYGNMLPEGHYFTVLALPERSTTAYPAFLEQLKRKKVLKDFSMHRVLHHNHRSINPTFFNFRSGKWELDWSKVRQEIPILVSTPTGGKTTRFDQLDLLLVKELQIDSLQHMVNIARKIGIHPKTLGYHYRSHLRDSGIITAFTVRWTKDIDSTLAHSVMVTKLSVQGYEKNNLTRIRLAVNRIPFVWAEYVLEKAGYVSFLCIPVEEALQAFDYLNRELSVLSERIELEFIRIADSCLFTIPYHMYQDEWTFDFDKLKSDFGRILARVKKAEVGVPA
jgi:DNA-binding Lrp family transcriptional regulator